MSNKAIGETLAAAPSWVKLNETVCPQVRENVLDSTAYSLLGPTMSG